MKKLQLLQRTKFLFTTAILLCITPLLVGWGVFGHERINRAAVLSLPDALRPFFYDHMDFMVQESTVPDLRKYTLGDKAEFPRHYVDLENYGNADSLPPTLQALKTKYDAAFLSENGILPWYIEDMMQKLTKAFQQKRKTEILFLAADLGHYIGDAHMPLHTTVNHDGLLTGQKGIHAFWESQLPELFGKNYHVSPVEAKYITDVHQEVWALLQHSHSLAAGLLKAEKALSETFPADKIYKTDPDGRVLKNKFNQPVHTVEYAKSYHERLNGMVEEQMAKAITATASFWYTAWVNAGKPDLNDLDAPGVRERNARALKEDLDLWKKGKLQPMESEKEF